MSLSEFCVAVGNDWHDISVDKYHNDEQDLVSFAFFPQTPDSLKAGTHHPCKISYKHGEIFPSSGLIGMVHRLELVPRGYAGFQPQRSDLIPTDRNNGVVHIFIDTDAHRMLKERFRSHNNPEFLLDIFIRDSLNTKSTSNALIRYEPIKFNNLKSVTNEGIIQSAKTAVELAIGLIGIMALARHHEDCRTIGIGRKTCPTAQADHHAIIPRRPARSSRHGRDDHEYFRVTCPGLPTPRRRSA